jgi:ABC-2 type transport system permease protein
MGIILTMTMVMMTGLAMTRERERGTMENLLAMPVQPIEVMSGKIVPYIFIGLIQATIILLAAVYMFGVPFFGSVVVLYGVRIALHRGQPHRRHHRVVACEEPAPGDAAHVLLLPAEHPALGLHVSVPGMPEWAQAIGSLVPATYFMRLVRGILLKGNDWADLWPNIWPMMIFTVVLMAVAVKFYRRTLD